MVTNIIIEYMLDNIPSQTTKVPDNLSFTILYGLVVGGLMFFMILFKNLGVLGDTGWIFIPIMIIAPLIISVIYFIRKVSNIWLIIFLNVIFNFFTYIFIEDSVLRPVLDKLFVISPSFYRNIYSPFGDYFYLIPWSLLYLIILITIYRRNLRRT